MKKNKWGDMKYITYGMNTKKASLNVMLQARLEVDKGGKNQ